MRSRQRTRTVPRVVLLGLALALCACAPKAIGARGPHRRRIAEVLRWVRDEVTFAGLEGFAPRPLRRVVAEGEADDYEKNLLLLFALEKRGVEAHFALIRPKDYGALDPKLPLPRQLKEALVFVPRQQGLSEPLWIAAHCHHCELGQLPLPMRDQPALLIKAKKLFGGKREAVVSFAKAEGKKPRSAEVERHTLVRLRADGSAEGEVRWRQWGSWQGSLVREIEALGSAAKRKRRLQTMIGKLVVGATLTGFQTKLARGPQEPGEVIARFEADSLAVPTGKGKLTLPLKALRLVFSDRFVDRKRHNPIDVGTPERYRRKVEIVAPARAQLAPPVLPAPQSSTYGKTSYRIEQPTGSDEKALVIVATLELPAGRYPPAKYKEFRRFILDASNVENRLVTVSTTGR